MTVENSPQAAPVVASGAHPLLLLNRETEAWWVKGLTQIEKVS